MIDSFILALQQPFFLRSLFVVVLLAIVFPLYGNIVVIREEANIAHTYAHVWLFGVAIWLWFDLSIDLVLFWSTILTTLFLAFLWKDVSSGQVVHNEIWAQLWLVWAILIVSQMTWYKADISSYLFGDILLLGVQDIYIISAIVLFCFLLYISFGRKWFAISLHKWLAKSKNIALVSSYLVYLIWLWLLIWWAMKIVGVLLVSAFLILPSNIWKLIAHNKIQWTVISVLACLVLSIISLFLSRYADMPSWASIVWLMILCYFIVIVVLKIRRMVS